MKPSDYPDVVQSVWAIHAAFRNLGFSSDDIFVRIAQNGEPCAAPGLWAFTELHAQNKTFTVTCLPLGALTDEEFAAKWTEFATKFNEREFEDEDLHAVYEKWFLHRVGAYQFYAGLTAKGFVPPVNMS